MRAGCGGHTGAGVSQCRPECQTGGSGKSSRLIHAL